MDDRQTGQAGRQTGRQADIQIDRQIDGKEEKGRKTKFAPLNT